MPKRPSREERELLDAQRRAAERRVQFERALYGAEVTGPQIDPQVPVNEERRNIRTPMLGLGVGAAICVLVAFGFPVFGNGWRPVGLLVGALLTLLAGYGLARSWFDATSMAKGAALVALVALPGVLAVGLFNQVVVDGRAHLSGSTTARAYSLAMELRDTLYILDENQALLTLPREQAAGLGDVYRAAAQQADEIAARWNPATLETPPLPGFVEVVRYINAAASMQRDALLLFEANIVQEDPARTAEIAKAAAATQESYTTAAARLATTVSPLGIDLVEEAG